MPSTHAPVPAPAVLADQAHPQNSQNLESPEISAISNVAEVADPVMSVEAGEPAAVETPSQVTPESAPALCAPALTVTLLTETDPTATLPTDAAAEAAPDAAPLEPAAVDQAAAPTAQAPARAELNPAACALQLKQLFPALFAGPPKPLKLRIQVDIQERSPGLFTKPMLTAFFRRYTGSTAYLIAVSRAKQRFDLDGQPSGELSQEHREVALAELTRRRANTESRIALEEQQRRNRATLLHDFGQTTLTPANFCALKGIAEGELDGYLATARREAEERPPQPAFEPRRAAGRQRPGPGSGRR